MTCFRSKANFIFFDMATVPFLKPVYPGKPKFSLDCYSPGQMGKPKASLISSLRLISSGKTTDYVFTRHVQRAIQLSHQCVTQFCIATLSKHRVCLLL